MRLLFLCSIISAIIIAQEKNHDQQIDNIVLFSINHTFHIPGGDLKKRFGSNSSISCVLSYKDNKIIYGLEAGFLFGSNVNETDLFDNIDGNNGNLISQVGEIPTIRLFQRGGYIDCNVGRYIPLPSKKAQSGLNFSIGSGYIYHKIFIETLVTALPQLNEDIIKGYDRLSGGFYTKQSIDYIHFGKQNNIRYNIGVNFIQAYTKDLRGYDYSKQTFITNKRIDYLLGLKCGFIIPIKERSTERYYYY